MTDRITEAVQQIEKNEHYPRSSAFLHEVPFRVEGQDFSLTDYIDLASHMATVSPRHRFNFMLHKDLKEDTQFLVNAVGEGNWVPPHKHENWPDRRETFGAAKGHFWIVLFDERGNITKTVKIDDDDPNAQKTFTIETGTIHTVISDAPFVALELKQHPPGGYRPADDKVFPDWSVRENTPETSSAFESLLGKVKKLESEKS